MKAMYKMTYSKKNAIDHQIGRNWQGKSKFKKRQDVYVLCKEITRLLDSYDPWQKKSEFDCFVAQKRHFEICDKKLQQFPNETKSIANTMENILMVEWTWIFIGHSGYYDNPLIRILSYDNFLIIKSS